MGMSGLGSKGGLQVRYTKRPKQYPEIHFDTAKSAIRPEGRKTLDDFVAGHLRGAILIEGHCDHRGDDQYNFELGKRRAKATKQYLVKAFKSAGKNVPEMVVMSLGETKSTGVSLDADRRALIISGAKGQWAAKRIVTKRALDFSKTGVYLIDASGSMADVWDIVKSHKFPKGSMLYSFNECRRVREGMPERTGCGTPLWDSLQTVLLQMNEKGSLTLISDGADTGRSGRSRLGRRKRRHDELEQTQDLNEAVKLATDKNITINVVYVGEPDEIHSIHMRDLAKGTGGKFYIRTD